MSRRLLVAALVVASVPASSAWAGTKFTTAWKAPEFTGFDLEASLVHPPEEAVVRIRRVARVVARGAEPVCATENDRADQLLERPISVHQLHGEEVEQLGMRWPLSGLPEVVDRPHESTSEQMVPHSIDDHP